MQIVDADTHIIETGIVWNYLTESEQRFRPQALELEQPILVPPVSRPINSVWLIDGQFYARTKLDALVERSKGELIPGTVDLTDPAARIRDMDRQGVDVQVIFPSLFLGLTFDHADAELAITRAYNRWLAESCSGSGGRLRWIMMPSVKNMAETVKDMDWARNNGAAGVLLRGMEYDWPLDDPYFDPIYAKASELDLPIAVHIGSSNKAYRAIRKNVDNRPSRFSMYFPTMTAFNAVLTSDLYKRFPALRFGFIEAGSEWIPYLVTISFMVRDNRDRAAFSSQILRERNIYVTCEDHEDLPRVFSYAQDSLVLASDYGHPGDVGESIMVQKAVDARADLNAAQKNKIIRTNGAAFLFGGAN